jgi:capsular exopolysaccharide synthesis family protein
MRSDSPLAVIGRRKWIIIATVLAFAVTTAVISKSLTKIYATDSTLLISLAADNQTFDTVQASQAIARSYADIIRNPNIAQQVADKLGADWTRSKVLDGTTMEVIPETQLLKVHAEDPSPTKAKLLADGYASTFIDFAKQNLEKSTKPTASQAVAAPVPTSAARPKPTLYTLVATLLGLALGLSAAFLRDRLDRRLRSADDVEQAFDARVLARVPRRGRSDTSRFAFKEAFRILRTNLQFSTGRGGPASSVAVTSWSAGEGKTTVSSQLAVAAAETGARVVVVESDFRRPAIQRELMPGQTQPVWPGLSNYLVQSASLDEVLHETPLPGVTLLPAGPLPPSPAGLLEAPRGQTLVDDLLERFDFVVFDCAPLSVGAEAAVISSWTDGVLLLVDLATSTDKGVRDAIRRLDTVQAPLLGLVVNRDRTLEPSAYDYYHAGSQRSAARERTSS